MPYLTAMGFLWRIDENRRKRNKIEGRKGDIVFDKHDLSMNQFQL